MPTINITKISETLIWGIWHIAEEAEQMLDLLRTPSSEEYHELAAIRVPLKRAESLAARLMVKTLLEQWDEDYQGVWKDEHRKPHLLHSGVQISFSHCFPYAVAIVDRLKPVGIDIEREREKLIKIQGKYLNTEEMAYADNRLELLCKFWSAKEAVYKANGRKAVSLRDQIVLDCPSFEQATLDDEGLHTYGLGTFSFGRHHVVFTA